MNQTEKSDISPLLKGCREYDRTSQQALYKLYYAYGMRICIRYVDSEEEAMLVLNDGFLKVFIHIKRYDETQPFKPWFRRILVNTALNYIKQHKKIKMEVDLQEAEHMHVPEEILSRIGYQELMAMVQSLSMAYRMVFNLYVIDGFKHEEIAEKLGITIGTSKSNLTRARAKLQELVRKKMNASYV